MRINIARPIKGVSDTFFKNYIREFANEFDFASIKEATAYVKVGKQGLKSFIEFLISQGFRAEMYALEPNRDLFFDVGDDWPAVSRTSPSYGFIIPDDDPLLVEFKIKNG
jgi:hypothetical protein